MLALPLCEMSDNDFIQTLDTDYMRCQYDANAVHSINHAGLIAVNSTQQEARQQEATRILSEPPRRRRTRNTAQPPPAPTHPPPAVLLNVHPTFAQLQLLRAQLRSEQLRHAQLQHQIQLLDQANDIILQHIIRFSQPQVVQPKPKMSVILKLDAPTEGVASCGICMSDEIPIANMVTTSCNHEYCDACISQIVSKKPCCAFCRGEITELCVNSHDVYNKLHVN